MSEIYKLGNKTDLQRASLICWDPPGDRGLVWAHRQAARHRVMADMAVRGGRMETCSGGSEGVLTLDLGGNPEKLGAVGTGNQQGSWGFSVGAAGVAMAVRDRALLGAGPL